MANAVNSGNGWGWENNRSCIFSSASNGSSSSQSSSRSAARHPTCSSAAINNGDGFGWENNTSCRYQGNTNANVSASALGNTAPAAVLRNANGIRECSANANDNGDGYGFEFGESCNWGRVQPATDRNSILLAPPPVAAATIGFQDGVPICLTDASDGNDGSFGYENNRSCRVVAGRTATSDRPLLNTR